MENGQKSTVRCAVDQNGPSRKTVGYGTVRYATVRYGRVRYAKVGYNTVRLTVSLSMSKKFMYLKYFDASFPSSIIKHIMCEHAKKRRFTRI
jgi:hypothetical protein